MTKYRKKPVVIEAIQLREDNVEECVDFVGEKGIAIEGNSGLFISTLEGLMRAEFGDFIIKGVNGEFYPCKPDIFEKTYEKVEE